MSERFVRIFWSQVPVEADLARALLSAADIPTRMQGTALLPGAIGIDTRVEVFVPEDRLDDALEVLGVPDARDKVGNLSLAEIQQEAGRLSLAEEGGEVSLATPETCPACGVDWEPTFEVCWNCQHALS